MKRALKGLLASLLVLACLGIAAVGVLQATGWNLIWGQYLQAGDGSHIMIDRHGDPIILGDHSRTGNLFHGLRDGDTVLFLCSDIQESYPARSRAYWCFRLERGTASNLPVDTLGQLKELRWLPATF